MKLIGLQGIPRHHYLFRGFCTFLHWARKKARNLEFLLYIYWVFWNNGKKLLVLKVNRGVTQEKPLWIYELLQTSIAQENVFPVFCCWHDCRSSHVGRLQKQSCRPIGEWLGTMVSIICRRDECVGLWWALRGQCPGTFCREHVCRASQWSSFYTGNLPGYCFLFYYYLLVPY